MIVFKNGTVITGDGNTLMKNSSVLVENEKIVDVTESLDPSVENYASEVIDCQGKAIIPGMINHHQHGIMFGPHFCSGAKNFGRERNLELMDRNLLQGVTTIMNVDGFVTMDEVRETQKATPMRLKTATHHTSLSVEAALKSDGTGLEEKHKKMTVEKMLEEGAICIGEIGGGQLLGGGGQDYLYIPMAVKKAYGKDIDYLQARAMKLSVLGRYIEGSYYDRERVAQALKEHNLDSFLTPEQTRDLVYKTTLASVKVSLDSYIEAAELAIKYDVPLLVHNAPTSMKKVHEIAKMGVKRLIAAHSNYLFTMEEALENTKKLRQYTGIIIDAAVHDVFGIKHLVAGPDNLFAFFKEDLADVISTDFAAGSNDSMLEAFEQGAKQGFITLPKAVKLGTKNVADALPGIAPNLGLLKKGYTADIVITAYPEVSKVERIYIGGKLVAKDGIRIV